jgi:PAS domain S-box-containing protein
MKSQARKNQRLTIGMLINQFDGMYQSPLWRGVAHAAEENNMNLIFFAGKSLKSPYRDESFHNAVYDAVNPERIDGLIAAAGVLASYIEKHELEQFLEQFRSIPIVSISFPIEGIPTIMIDSKTGMRKVVNHLISHHGYKNIAFIKGPEGNPDADDRFQAYIESLESNHIQPNPELICRGDFITPGGETAALELLQKKGLKIDAIVAANDEMAIGAYQAIKKMGLRIPQDIAVTGFDDAMQMQISTPPCTSVKNPVYDIAIKAVETLIELLNGKNVPKEFYLPSEPVFRQSCGCYPESLSNRRVEQLHIQETGCQDPDRLNINKIVRLLDFPEQNRNYYESLFKNLLESLLEDLENKGKSERFLNLMDIVINQIDFENDKTGIWRENFSIMSDTVLSILKNLTDQNLYYTAKDILDKAQILFCNTIISKDTLASIGNELVLWGLRDMLKEISSSITVDKLMKAVEDLFPVFGIKSCYITQFLPEMHQNNELEKMTLPQQSRLLTGFNEYHYFTRDKQNFIFTTREIIPDEILSSHRRYTLIVMPILRQSELLGLFISELGPKVDIVYSVLREQISNALVSCKLFRDVELAESRLKNTLIELQKSEERFREMAMFLPTIIIETDLNMDLTFLNQAGFELFGMDPQKLLKNSNLTDFVRNDDRERLKQYCARIIYGELPNLSDIKLINQKGQEINLVSRASLIKREDRIEGIRWSAIDIKPLITSVFVPDNAFFDKFRLSKRESEIVTMLLQGYRNKEIANRLFISENTVRVHIYYIYSKINVKNKTEFFETLKNYQASRFGNSSFMFSILSSMIRE